MSYEGWFIYITVLEICWFALRLQYMIFDDDQGENSEWNNRVLRIPQELGIAVLIFWKFNSIYTRFDKYALTSTLYTAFTVHLTNFFFSIPAVIIN